MKKLLLGGALVLFGMTNAQVKFGIKGGYSLANMNTKNLEDVSYDPKSAFYIGGLLEYKINDNLGIQGELLYTSLGGNFSKNYNLGGFFMDIENKTNIGTLLLPVSVKYYPSQGFALLGGINLGFMLSAKEKNSINHNLPLPHLVNEFLEYNTGKRDIKNEIKTLDVAPFIGIEYGLSNGLFFETRYNIGITNTLDIGEYRIGNLTPKVFNRYWQLGLGYKF